jgi:hypothetical protein
MNQIYIETSDNLFDLPNKQSKILYTFNNKKLNIIEILFGNKIYYY